MAEVSKNNEGLGRKAVFWVAIGHMIAARSLIPMGKRGISPFLHFFEGET